MILYLDSSSIVSRHLKEEGRWETVEEAARGADRLSCSRVAYAEVRSALSRALRNGRFNEADHDSVLTDLDRDWPHYLRVSAGERLVRRAGQLAHAHGLKGYDAIHLASALLLQSQIPEPVAFSTWDDRLARAAATAGLQLAHDPQPDARRP